MQQFLDRGLFVEEEKNLSLATLYTTIVVLCLDCHAVSFAKVQ